MLICIGIFSLVSLEKKKLFLPQFQCRKYFLLISWNTSFFLRFYFKIPINKLLKKSFLLYFLRWRLPTLWMQWKYRHLWFGCMWSRHWHLSNMFGKHCWRSLWTLWWLVLWRCHKFEKLCRYAFVLYIWFTSSFFICCYFV